MPSAFSAVYTHIYRILCVVLNVHAAMYQIAHLKYTKPKPVLRSRTVVNVAFVCAFFLYFSLLFVWLHVFRLTIGYV